MTVSTADAGSWWVYVLECDGRLYTGITLDPSRRLREHAAGGSRAARFTRAARTLVLRYSVEMGPRGTALRVEHRIKRLTRAAKLALLRQSPSADELLLHLQLQG